MEIIDIFAIVKNSLYSVQFESEEFNEFAKCFELWNDPVYLRDFFEMHKEDLKSEFWGGITIEEAILKTRNDAGQLERELIDIAENGKTEKLESLSTIFEPLSIRELGRNFEKDKAKGLSKNSWLRLYAIRIELNLFVVCGGAIKLTHKMNMKKHLTLELDKLEFTRNYLQNDTDEILQLIEIS